MDSVRKSIADRMGRVGEKLIRTSPNRRSILKLRLLIFSCGEPGKQAIQLVRVDKMSITYLAITMELGRELQTKVGRDSASGLLASGYKSMVSALGFT